MYLVDRAVRSGSYQTDPTASDDDIALDYLPHDRVGPEAMEGHRDDAEVDTEV